MPTLTSTSASSSRRASSALAIVMHGTAAAWLLAASFAALAQTANLPPPPVSPAPVALFEYDAEGNPTKQVLAPNAASSPGSNLTNVQTYDSLGRRKTHKDARNGLTQFTYDGQDQLIQVQDPRKLLTKYERNGLGDVQKLSSPDTGISPATFDAAGQVKTRTDARGFVSSHEYDALGRLKSLQIKSPIDSSLRNFAWTYDLKDELHGFGIGRLGRTQSPEVSSDFRYDALGRILETRSAFQGDSASLAVVYGYDPAGRITSIRYPSGRLVTFSYEQGQVTGIKLQADAGSTAQALLSDIKQSPFGPLQSWRWQQAVNNSTRLHERLFDSYGRPLRYPLGLWVRDLSYDAADRISAYTQYDASSAAPVTSLNQKFSYDELGRLGTATMGNQAWSYAYDANGNRTQARNSSGLRTHTIASTSNRVTSISNPVRAFSYDASGNILSDGNGGSAYTAVYNHEGRLAELSSGSLVMKLAYDAQGQRFRKQIGSNLAVYFAYDLQGQLLGEYTLIGNSFKPLMEYIWLEGQPVAAVRPTPGAVANAPNSAQEVFYLHTDHLGTPRVALDTAGRVRWRWMGGEPFGLSPAENAPTAGLSELNISLRLPGQQYDGFVGLHYNYFRDYDPTTGRYVQSDPIGLRGGINTYAYAGGNPTNFADPLGLWSTDAHDYFIDTFFPNVPTYERSLIKQGSEYADSLLYQDGAHSFMHGMSSDSLNQEKAKQLFCKFLSEKMKTYNRDLNRSRGLRNAYINLGMALHAIMDSTSPVHRGFQKWDSSQIDFHGPRKFGPLNRPYTREDIDVAPRYREQTHRRMRELMNGQLPAECGCQ